MDSSAHPRTEHWRVPVRVDLAGGTLDLWPLYALLGGGTTVNAALDLWIELAVVREGEGHSVRSRDLGLGFQAQTWPAECPEPGLSWVWRVLNASGRAPAQVEIHSPVPKGSGLGTSSCLAVGLLGASHGIEAGPELAARVPLLRDLEAQELQTPTGWQDYYPAALGGCLALHFDRPEPRWERLRPHPALLENLLVFYTGAPHHSGLTNWEAYRRFLEGDSVTRSALGEIARIAEEMVLAVPQDPDEVARLLEREGEQRIRLSPAVQTEAMVKVREFGRREGWYAGMKPCGAGGGGCCLLVTKPEGRGAAQAALEALGLPVLEAGLSPAGLHRR